MRPAVHRSEKRWASDQTTSMSSRQVPDRWQLTMEGASPGTCRDRMPRSRTSAIRRRLAPRSSSISGLLELGACPEDVVYLLPNAHAVRFHESGSLLNYLWKWSKRLCFTAQREIFDTSVEEVAQVAALMPTIGRYIGPPCVLRAAAGQRPCCPEGDRYCGVPVWRDYGLERSPSELVSANHWLRSSPGVTTCTLHPPRGPAVR